MGLVLPASEMEPQEGSRAWCGFSQLVVAVWGGPLGKGPSHSLWRLQWCRECERNERIMDVLNESRDFFKKYFICIL